MSAPGLRRTRVRRRLQETPRFPPTRRFADPTFEGELTGFQGSDVDEISDLRSGLLSASRTAISSGAPLEPLPPIVVIDSPLVGEQMIIISLDAQVIAHIKQRLPAIGAFWLCDFQERGLGRWEPTVDQIIETAKRVGADGVDLNANLKVIEAKFVAEIRRIGLELHVWTVNDPLAAKRLMKLGVGSITTDRPGWLRTQLDLRRR